MPVDIAGWAKVGVAALVASGSVLLATGSNVEKVKTTQAQLIEVVKKQQEDHDTVTKLVEKVNGIDERTKEISADVKSLLGEQRHDRSQADEKRRTR